MTAKSETVGVVAYRYRRRPDGKWSLTHFKAINDLEFEAVALAPESSLAELTEKLNEQVRHTRNEVDGWQKCREKYFALLSGLEALAGEWEKTADSRRWSDGCSGYEASVYDECVEKIRALIPAAANTESEEVK